MESLSKFVPLKILPAEMGGSAGSLESLHTETIAKLEKNRTWFLNVEERMKVDEKRRKGKSKTSSDIFGSTDVFGAAFKCEE